MTANKRLSVDFATDKQELLLKCLPVSKDNRQVNGIISYTANLPATYIGRVNRLRQYKQTALIDKQLLCLVM